MSGVHNVDKVLKLSTKHNYCEDHQLTFRLVTFFCVCVTFEVRSIITFPNDPINSLRYLSLYTSYMRTLSDTPQHIKYNKYIHLSRIA